jgi:hypothetical protein
MPRQAGVSCDGTPAPANRGQATPRRLDRTAGASRPAVTVLVNVLTDSPWPGAMAAARMGSWRVSALDREVPHEDAASGHRGRGCVGCRRRGGCGPGPGSDRGDHRERHRADCSAHAGCAGRDAFQNSCRTNRRRSSAFSFAAVKHGRTTEEAIAAVRRNPETSFDLVDIVASAGLAPGGRRAVTAQIRANTTYLLVNDVGQDEKPAAWIITPLAAGGAPTGAAAPAPDAEVQMRDLRFVGDSTLPRRGTVRVRNVGWAPHFALAFPLRRGASRSPFVGRSRATPSARSDASLISATRSS